MASARLRTLMDQRARAWEQVKSLQDARSKEGFQPTEEDGATYTRALDDVDKLSQEIETEERAERIEAAMNAPTGDQRSTNPRSGEGGGEPDLEARYAAAFTAYLRDGMSELDLEQRRLLSGRSLSGTELKELRAQGIATGAAGGFLVPTEFINRMVEAQKAFGGIAQHAEVITTDSGAPMEWPTNDDTGNIGALISENTADTEQDLAFGEENLGAKMYTSRLVRLSLELMQDSAFNIEGWLPSKLGQRIGRAAAGHYALGNGTTQPQGLAVGLTGSTSSANGVVGFDDLTDLEHSIDPAYRGTNARYIVHDSVVKSLRKVKDTTGRPLWQPAYTVGAPSTINGQPYTVDNGLEALAAGSKSVVFGDIRTAYLIRQVRGAAVMRLTERYAEYRQVGFVAFQRLDAIVQDSSAAKVLTTKAP